MFDDYVACDKCHGIVRVSKSRMDLEGRYVVHVCVHCGNYARYMDKFEFLVRTAKKKNDK